MNPRVLALVALLMPLAARAGAETYVWVDENGTTHLTSDRTKVPEPHRQAVVGDSVELRSLWEGDVRGPVPEPLIHDSNRPEARTARHLRGAVDDLRQGETARASAKATAPAPNVVTLRDR